MLSSIDPKSLTCSASRCFSIRTMPFQHQGILRRLKIKDPTGFQNWSGLTLVHLLMINDRFAQSLIVAWEHAPREYFPDHSATQPE